MISIKPPIIVNELAERMGLKPFQIMADLIKLQVFVAPTAAIEPTSRPRSARSTASSSSARSARRATVSTRTEEVIVEPEAPDEEPRGRAARCARRSSPSWATSTTARPRCSTSSASRGSPPARPAASPSTSVPIRSSTRASRSPSSTPRATRFSPRCAPAARTSPTSSCSWSPPTTASCRRRMEAINHAKAAGKTIIVAINKCDLPGADLMRVKSQLAENGLQTTDFGGDTEFVEVSAITGQGMDDLLELIALQAEVLELKANPKANARAAVIEARVQPGRGATATVIVRVRHAQGRHAVHLRPLRRQGEVAHQRPRRADQGSRARHAGGGPRLRGAAECRRRAHRDGKRARGQEAGRASARRSARSERLDRAAAEPPGGPAQLRSSTAAARRSSSSSSRATCRARSRRSAGRAGHRVRQGRGEFPSRRRRPDHRVRHPAGRAPRTRSCSASTSRSKPRP